MNINETKALKSMKNSVKDTKNDTVNHPEHYTEGGIETLDYLKAKSNTSEYVGYLRLNCLKYLSRAPYKGSGITDLKKCFYYLNLLIDELEEQPPLASALLPGEDTREYLEKLNEKSTKEELIQVMKQDFDERSKNLSHLENTCISLLNKLDKANKEIKELRNDNEEQKKEEYYGA